MLDRVPIYWKLLILVKPVQADWLLRNRFILQCLFCKIMFGKIEWINEHINDDT